jgi:DNA recombination protein RmuC
MSPDTAPAGAGDLTFVFLILALFAAGAAVWFFLESRRAVALVSVEQAKLAGAEARLETLGEITRERDEARAEGETARRDAARLAAELAGEKSAAAAREEALLAMKGEAEKSFLALAAQALDRNETRFLALANETFEKHKAAASGGVKEVLQPVTEQMARLVESVTKLDKEKTVLGEQMRAIGEAMKETQSVTRKLETALRSAPKMRGNWGESTLRNILELAGLSPFADFTEQTTVSGDDGGKLRPDVVIRMPGGGTMVVDSKVALAGYFEALDATDEAMREAALQRHAAQVRAHAKRLAAQDYAQFVPNAIDFVVMFIPGESFFAAALERDPELFEYATRHKVIICTPATLVALAKAVAYGWRQEESARNAQEIAGLGRELHRRVAGMVDKVSNLGNSLEKSLKSYNEMVGTLEARVLPQARKFKDLGAGDPEVDVKVLEPSELAPRLPAPQGELDLGAAAGGAGKTKRAN